MSKWCDTCYRNEVIGEWKSCDASCPMFGKHYEDDVLVKQKGNKTMKEFTKADLQVGYIIEDRGGNLKMVMPAVKELVLAYEDGSWGKMANLDDDLTLKECSDWYRSKGTGRIYELQLDIGAMEGILVYEKQKGNNYGLRN